MILLTVAAVLAALPAAQAKQARELEQQAHDLQAEGKFLEAQQPLQQAIALWEKAGPADRIEVLNDRVNLAAAYRRHGEPAKAVPLLEPTVKELQRLEHPDAPPMLRAALNNLATSYMYLERPADARHTWERCLALAGEGKPDAERARVLDNLAALELGEGDLDAADRYARKGYAEWIALRGKEDVDVAISTSTLGTIAMRRKKFDEARKLLHEALRVQEKLQGKDHPEVGAVLNLIGELELTTGHREAARTALERSYAIAKRSLTEDSSQFQEAKAGLEKLGLTPKP